MKTYKLILSGLLATMVALSAQSCLFEQEDVFDKASSLRLQEAMDKTAEILRTPEKGWYMELYPQVEQEYGGYVFTCKFVGDTVTVHTELDEPGNVAKSFWRMTNDNGPVLTFDTYNDYIHYFSTPSSSSYEAFEGEFQFMIMEASANEVKMRGTRTGNTIILRPLEIEAEEYVEKVQAIDESLIMTGLNGTINGYEVKGVIDTDSRQIDFTLPKTALNVETSDPAEPDTTITLAYCLTDSGLRFYKPMEVADVSLYSFILNEDSSLSSKDAVGVAFKAVFPEGWRPYSSFAGEYTFQYYNYTGSQYKLVEIPVTLTPNSEKTGFIMSGVNPKFDIVLKYKKSYGVLNMTSQAVGDYNKNKAWMCAWALAAGGTLTWATEAGLQTVWNDSETAPEYYWVNNEDSSYPIDSMLLWQLNSAGSSVGVLSDNDWYFTGATGSYGCRMYYLAGRSSLNLAPCRLIKK